MLSEQQDYIFKVILKHFIEKEILGNGHFMQDISCNDAFILLLVTELHSQVWVQSGSRAPCHGGKYKTI